MASGIVTDTDLDVLLIDMEVIQEYVADADFSRISLSQTQYLRQHVDEASRALDKLESCLRELCDNFVVREL